MWLYFYTCKYTSIYRNKQIHLNIFNEKNKKIRKQKCNKIFILFSVYIFIYFIYNITDKFDLLYTITLLIYERIIQGKCEENKHLYKNRFMS